MAERQKDNKIDLSKFHLMFGEKRHTKIVF